MAIIIWLISGAFVGWLANIIMRHDGESGPLADIVLGVAGAFIGGSLLAGGTSPDGGLSINSIVIALIGAIIVLGAVHLYRAGALR